VAHARQGSPVPLVPHVLNLRDCAYALVTVAKNEPLSFSVPVAHRISRGPSFPTRIADVNGFAALQTSKIGMTQRPRRLHAGLRGRTRGISTHANRSAACVSTSRARRQNLAIAEIHRYIADVHVRPRPLGPERHGNSFIRLNVQNQTVGSTSRSRNTMCGARLNE